MTREQWCREHIEEVAKRCHLSNETVKKVTKARAFTDDHPAFNECPTEVVLTVLKVRNPEIRNKVILEIESILTKRKPNGEWVKRKLTEKEVQKIISKHQPIVNKPKEEILDTQPQKKLNPNDKSRSLIIDILEPGERKVIDKIIALEYASNEYEAIKIVIKWAVERIEQGESKEVR